MSARRLRLALASVGLALLATSARADAPSGQYGLFNQSNATIVDSFTGLRWERFPAPAPAQPTFAQAAAYCAGLGVPGASSGWRVPSYKELLTLVDENPQTEYQNDAGILVVKWIDTSAFPGTVAGPYWTSSLALAGGAYAVDFSDGAGVILTSTLTGLATANVRCVQ